MIIFPSLPDNPQLSDVFKRFTHTVPPLLDYHDRLLRDPSPLTVAQRELIAAYVSGLNACDFCHGAHIIAARVFGVDQEVFEQLMNAPDSAPVEERLKPILAYVKKLTLTPSRLAPSDAQKVFAVGWDEQALFDAISVCALFNMMNRIVLGSGVTEDPRRNAPEDVSARSKRMGEPGSDPFSAPHSYARLLEAYGIQARQMQPAGELPRTRTLYGAQPPRARTAAPPRPSRRRGTTLRVRQGRTPAQGCYSPADCLRPALTAGSSDRQSWSVRAPRIA